MQEMNIPTHIHNRPVSVFVYMSDSFLNLAVELPSFFFSSVFHMAFFHFRKSHVRIHHESGLV